MATQRLRCAQRLFFVALLRRPDPKTRTVAILGTNPIASHVPIWGRVAAPNPLDDHAPSHGVAPQPPAVRSRSKTPSPILISTQPHPSRKSKRPASAGARPTVGGARRRLATEAQFEKGTTRFVRRAAKDARVPCARTGGHECWPGQSFSPLRGGRRAWGPPPSLPPTRRPVEAAPGIRRSSSACAIAAAGRLYPFPMPTH